MGINSLVPRGPTKVYGADGTFLGESLCRVEWMRPDLLEPPTPKPVATRSSALAPSAAPTLPTESQTPDCLPSFVKQLQRRHDISSEVATAIALAALSAVVGPGRTVRNPLGGTVTAALNIIITDEANAETRRAARQALLPFQHHVEKTIATHQEKGPKQLRQLRMELDQECARAVHRLHHFPEKVPEPLTIPVPRAERRKDALAEAVVEVEQAVKQLDLVSFEERPFLVVDGFSASEIALIPQRSFDGALLSFSPDGGALRSLATRRVDDRQQVLRYLVAAWHGNSFAAGNQTILRPWVTNLWLLPTDAASRLWRNPAIAASDLLETFLVVTNEPAGGVDIDASAETPADENWRDLMDATLGERIRGLSCEHRLSAAAAKRFLEFRVQALRRGTTDSRKFVAWWPEQLLKIALLLHVDLVGQDVPVEIELATLEAAISVMEGLGSAQLRVAESMTTPRQDPDAVIELMVAKVRLSGPMPKWNLFRRFHTHRAEVMEPLLVQCCERNLLRVDNDLVQLADAET